MAPACRARMHRDRRRHGRHVRRVRLLRVGLDQPRWRREQAPFERVDERVVAPPERRRERRIEEPRHPYRQRGIRHVGVAVRPVEAVEHVLAVPRLGAEVAHLWQEALLRRARDHRPISIAQFRVHKRHLREPQRHHLVRHQRPLAGEAIARLSPSLCVVALLEPDQLLAERRLRGGVAVHPRARLAPAPPRGHETHDG
jgi:hypothetical protein